MQVVPFFDADSGTFSYLVDAGGAAAVIDPVLGFDPASGRSDRRLLDRQLSLIESRGLQLRWVLETHAHADHLSGAQYLKDRTGAQVAIGRGITEVQRRFRRVFDLGGEFAVDGSQFDRLLEDGDTLALGGQTIEVMATPGHTSDGMSYRIDSAVFVGDTLFAPDYGTARCDFPGGDAGRLYDSIQRIHALPAFTRIYLCHDYPPDGRGPRCETTVATSRARNVHVHRGVSREDFVALREARDAGLAIPRLLLAAIQVNIRAGRLPDTGDNGVGYLRLPVDADLEALTRD